MSISVAQVISATGVPTFVKNAKVTDDGEYDCKTRESTYISWARAVVKQASAEEQAALLKSAKFWGIEKECQTLGAKYAELLTPPKIEAGDYALSFEYEGRQIQKFASCDGPTTVEAAINFYEQRRGYDYPQRAMAAHNLLHKAASLDVELPAYVNIYLQKAAAFGAFAVKGLEDALVSREQLCPIEYKEELAKIASVIESLIESETLRTDYDFIKAAMTTIDAFDAETGIQGALIEESIADHLLVSELQKIASAPNYQVKLVNGREVDVRGLEKAALSAVSPELSIISIDKLAEVLPTLPREDADLLTALIS